MDKLIFEVDLKRNRVDGGVKPMRICLSSFIYTTGKDNKKEKKPLGSLFKPNNYLTNRITIGKPNNYDDIYNIQGVTNGI